MTLLTADVGGTHARLALLDPVTLSIERFECFSGVDFPSLAVLCAEFLARGSAMRPTMGVIAIAGVERDGHIEGKALPWRVSMAEVREMLRIPGLVFINDFVAAALGTREVAPTDRTWLSAYSARKPRADDEPILVLGPGTGFGAAVLLPNAGPLITLASEAGQAALAPGTDLEIDLLRALRGGREILSNGDVLSGPGLSRIDEFLRARHGIAGTRTPAQVIAAAVRDHDPLSRQAVNVFCELLGAVAGDLALIYKASGGVCLVGGILPRVRPILLESRFLQRFTAKGCVREFLEDIPVSLVEHPHLGVLGAARWHAQHCSPSL